MQKNHSWIANYQIWEAGRALLHQAYFYSLPKSQLPLIKETTNSSRELFPLHHLISFVKKLLTFSLPGNISLHQQHQPQGDRKHANSDELLPKTNFHTASSSPKILDTTKAALLWLQPKAHRCSPDAARLVSEVEKGASAVTNRTGLDLLLLKSADAYWQRLIVCRQTSRMP